MTAACSGVGAVGEVESQLDILKKSRTAEAGLAGVKEELPESALGDFDSFLPEVD